MLAALVAACAALVTWSVADPSLNHAASTPIHNLLGRPGAVLADVAMQFFGLACVVALIPPAHWGWRLTTEKRLDRVRNKLVLWVVGSALAAGCASMLPVPASWPLPTGLGGVVGDAVLWAPRRSRRLAARPGRLRPGPRRRRDPVAHRRRRLPPQAGGQDRNRADGRRRRAAARARAL